MDGTRFDAATKALATATSRRSLLKRFAGGAVVLAATRAFTGEAVACTAPGPLAHCNADSECCENSRCLLGICQCPSGQKNCGGRCIPSGDSCGPQYCPTGYRQCGTTCIDTSRDRNNCGACGHVCAVTQSCSNGRCCSKGKVFCDGTCKLASQCTLVS